MLSFSPPQTVAAPTAQAPTAKASPLIRSKSGCLTCKAKHSKCDETRPTCKRCAAKGLVCGGYPSEAQWTFKHLIFRQDSQQSSGLSSTTHSFTTATVAENQQQCQTPKSRPKAAVGTGKASSSSSSALGPSERRGSRSRVSRHSQEKHRRRRLSTASTSTVTSLPSAASSNESASQPSSPSGTWSQALMPASSAANPSQSAPLITSFLTDNASAFIINWFQQVCPAWSGFDSDANWNRKIAIDLWQSSAAVNSALESMSASFLASRVPNLRQASLRLMSRATDFIQAELQMVKSQPVLCTIPAGVMFAMFCMGTTICWVDPRGLGLPFFRELRALLRRLNAQPRAAWSRSSSELLDYFNRSMVYCEMLLAVVSDDQKTDLLDDNPTTAASESSLVRAAPDILHPWTGISTSSSSLFAESVRLCRGSRARLRQPLPDAQACFTATVQDLLQAQSLEEKLLALEFGADLQLQVSDTGDLATPQSHLAMIAEAYRLSALLHLYQTFPELAFQRLPTEATGVDPESTPSSDAMLWKDWIVPLALHLVKILEQIPPSSGSRVIQPLLYISAATGLRNSAAVPTPGLSDMASSPSSSMNDTGWEWRRRPSQQSLPESGTLTSYITHITSSGGYTLPDPVAMDAVSLEITHARHFILKRLGMFETSLPPAPIVVAKELVSTIWRAYDQDVIEGLYMVHWIDVMELNDLRSLFG